MILPNATPAMPPQHVVDHAMHVALMSPCRSKRGVVLWDASTGAFCGHGFNAPPQLQSCPGRPVCAGTCGQRAVHAEVRAVIDALRWRQQHAGAACELLHVELASTLLVQPAGPVSARVARDGVAWGQSAHVTLPGALVACDGPRCGPCAAVIADVGFVGGVWLFEANAVGWAGWRRYTAEQFYEATADRLVPHPQTFSLGFSQE